VTTLPATIELVKLLGTVLAVQVVLGLTLVVLVATDNVPFADGGDAKPSTPTVDRFDSAAAWRLPRGRYQQVPGGLRNVVGTVHGRERGYIVVGAHYDTKDIDGFVGANDGAAGTAVVTELARTIRRPRHSIRFVLFDGEESPRGSNNFLRDGLRGSRVAAARFGDARAMVLLDFVGNKRLSIPREAYSNELLWRKLRRAAKGVGAGRSFPNATQGGIQDDHLPFIQAGVPAIDLIDFTFPCWHRTCDDLSAVSERSLDGVGETLVAMLASL